MFYLFEEQPVSNINRLKVLVKKHRRGLLQILYKIAGVASLYSCQGQRVIRRVFCVRCTSL